MDLQLMAWEVPLRVCAGAFILNSGLAKLRADDAAAKQTHGPWESGCPDRSGPALASAGLLAIGLAFVVDDVRDRLRGKT